MGMLELFEGNDASQNMVCTLTWTQVGIMTVDQKIKLSTCQSTWWDFTHFDACSNDEVRSGMLFIAEYGTTITVYDSPSGDKADDWTEIKVNIIVPHPAHQHKILKGESRP